MAIHVQYPNGHILSWVEKAEIIFRLEWKRKERMLWESGSDALVAALDKELILKNHVNANISSKA